MSGYFRRSTAASPRPSSPPTVTCPMEIAGELFTCRLYLDEVGRISPGSEATVPMRFLAPELVAGKLEAGSELVSLFAGLRIPPKKKWARRPPKSPGPKGRNSNLSDGCCVLLRRWSDHCCHRCYARFLRHRCYVLRHRRWARTDAPGRCCGRRCTTAQVRCGRRYNRLHTKVAACCGTTAWSARARWAARSAMTSMIR